MKNMFNYELVNNLNYFEHMTRKNRIENLLNEALLPQFLEVEDKSHLHAGHAGARPEGETHYSIKISAKSLDNMNRIKQHQEIYKALDLEMNGERPIHALEISVIKIAV